MHQMNTVSKFIMYCECYKHLFCIHCTVLYNVCSLISVCTNAVRVNIIAPVFLGGWSNPLIGVILLVCSSADAPPCIINDVKKQRTIKQDVISLYPHARYNVGYNC